MANPVLQLAEHIDEVCGLGTTGGVASFFDESGNLRPCNPGENIFAFNVACSLNIYDPEEHDSFIQNVWNNLEGDLSGLKHIQKALDEFQMPELDTSPLQTIYGVGITFEDLIPEVGEGEERQNVTVYDAAADEYYPASLARAGFSNDVLDEGHIVIVINQIPQSSEDKDN